MPFGPADLRSATNVHPWARRTTNANSSTAGTGSPSRSGHSPPSSWPEPRFVAGCGGKRTTPSTSLLVRRGPSRVRGTCRCCRSLVKLILAVSRPFGIQRLARSGVGRRRQAFWPSASSRASSQPLVFKAERIRPSRPPRAGASSSNPARCAHDRIPGGFCALRWPQQSDRQIRCPRSAPRHQLPVSLPSRTPRGVAGPFNDTR